MATSVPLSRAEFTGLGAIAKARQENLSTLFAGTSLTFNFYSKATITYNVLSNAGFLGTSIRSLVGGIKTGAKAPAALSTLGDLHTNGVEFLKIATNLHDLSDVVAALGSDTMNSLISEMTPFLGVLSSSYSSVQSWRAVVANVRDLYKSDYYLEGVLPGDPTAAAQAVFVVIRRYLASNTADAVRYTAAATTKIAGLFVDLGTATTAAIGAASSLAGLIKELAILGRDYTEMKAANALLKTPGSLDLNVFRVCPTLGCYLISCSDTSMVVNMFVADIGLPGWQDKVETMKKNQLEPLIKIANKAIVDSHLTLTGLQANKGALASKGTMDRIKDSVKHHFNQLVRSRSSKA